jgi:hypothetical protein
MPKQVVQSALAAKLGQAGAKAVEAHKDDEARVGVAPLPAGIEGGVAQLTMCKFDVYKEGDLKGEFYFMAMGSVLKPREIGGVGIAGLYTQLGPIPVCDTPKRTKKTVEEHVDEVLNHLRLLGVDTKEIPTEQGPAAVAAWLENAAAALQQSQPTFRFRTWIGTATPQFPTPRVQHSWLGACEYEADGTEVPVVQDTTPEAVVEDEQADDSRTEEDQGDAGEDLNALAEKADGGDRDAAEALQDMALKAGIKQKQIDATKDWAEVAAMVQETPGGSEEAAGGETAEEEEAEPEPVVPSKGSVYKFKAPKAKKLSECEVLQVMAKAQTVNLRDLDSPGKKTVYKDVPWDKLIANAE